MAAEVRPLAPVKLPKGAATLTRDQKIWSSFSDQVVIPSATGSPVTHISSNASVSACIAGVGGAGFGPVTTYIAVTTGPRLQLLAPQTLKVAKTITRTTSPFHAAHVRSDGRICISGSDSGAMQAFDVNSRAILKTWHEHKQPVWATKWHPRNMTQLLSCSDDRTVRLWDLPSDRSIWSGLGHHDYVRCGVFLGQAGMIVTGSYDQSVRVWDPRIGARDSSDTGSCVMNFKLTAPVESLVSLPGGTSIAASSGDRIAALDLIAGRPLGLFQNHQKTITSLAVASHGSRVLSGALDGHVKVWDTAQWKVVAGHKYSSPVLSLDVIAGGADKEDRHICVGMQSGLLSIKSRVTGAAKAAKKEKELEMAALVAGKIDEFDAQKKKRKGGRGYEMAVRGKDFTGEGVDVVIEGNARLRTKKLNRWEKSLRKGEYQESLDLAIDSDKSGSVYTILTALHHRSALRAALSDRTAQQLLPIIQWLIKSIEDPRLIRLKVDVAMLVLDLYGKELGKSPEVDGAIEELLERTKEACEASQMCWATLGMVDLLSTDAASR